MTEKLRIAFMGTPDLVLPTVKALHESAHDLVCVYTQPPREKGRKRAIEKTPVHLYAEELGVDVRHPVNFKSEEDVQDFKDLNLDVAIVAAYGMLLPKAILKATGYGCINIHPSLLPKWRGPSPVQYAIWNGDDMAGVSVMLLEQKMDSGPIIKQIEYPIEKTATFLSLNEKLWTLGTDALIEILNKLDSDRALHSVPQDHDQATYCKLLTKEDGRINWEQSAEQIDCQIRGLNPWPGTWCLDENDKRLKIISAEPLETSHDAEAGHVIKDGIIACGHNTALKLLRVQPENKPAMNIKDVLNGGALKTGMLVK